MDIRSGIDDAGLKRLFGLLSYNKSTTLLNNGAVSPPNEVHPGITVYLISDPDGAEHVVLRRCRSNGDELLDCDCANEGCEHIAAVLLSDLNSHTAEEATDSELIRELEDLIDSIVDDILDDPDYDEEANYYDDWHYGKYDLDDENYNYEVEHDHTKAVLDRIIYEITEPNATILLIDRLLMRLSTMEYDNGGVYEAFDEHGSDIYTLFAETGPETIAEVLKNRDHYAQTLYRESLKHVPKETIERAYQLLDDSSELGEVALKMKFDRGDYESYIRSSSDKLDAIIRVVRKLDAENDDSAAKYAGMLIGYDGTSKDQRAARLLSSHGYKEEAADIYLNLFLMSHKHDDFQSMKINTSRIDTERLLDNLASTVLSHENFDNDGLETLILEGRATDVDRYIKKTGFAPSRNFKDYDCHKILDICDALVYRGFVESAAILGRGLILLRLNVKNADRYQDAVVMLQYMDRESRFEGLDEPHSRFKLRLQEEFPKMRKFWGLYTGTWNGRT